MRIRTVFRVDCSAETAWHAAHSPAAAARLYAPLMRMVPLTGAMPLRFSSGDRVEVSLRLFDVLTLGTQSISITDIERSGFPPGARTMRDGGRPLSGPLALLRDWNHEITVWPTGTDSGTGRSTAVWHDELTVGGAAAPLFAPILWPMWQWRKHRLRRLARRLRVRPPASSTD